MSQRPGFKNIQIQAKQDLYDLFEETFRASGANTKAEFLNWLLEGYLNPEESSSKDSKVQKDLEAVNDNLNKVNSEIETLKNRLALYETNQLKKIFDEHKGEKLSFTNAHGKKMVIEINDLPDVFSAIFNSVKID
jgi:predicted DNA-binding protein YlxM (UPF0122 family)